MTLKSGEKTADRAAGKGAAELDKACGVLGMPLAPYRVNTRKRSEGTTDGQGNINMESEGRIG